MFYQHVFYTYNAGILVPVASSADQANPMKLREHNENCYENQYMVDVKAKNSSLLFANDVC